MVQAVKHLHRSSLTRFTGPVKRMLKSKKWWWLTAILMLISDWSQCIKPQEITVDPPENVGVDDLGHLGQLDIHWTSPVSLTNLTDCSMRYHLEYFNTYQNRWTVIRTVRTWYRAQFDLEKEVRVRISTVLRGACTNGTELKSPFTEMVLPPNNTGPGDSRVQGFGCVFYQKEVMDCTWETGLEEPAHSKHSLYFWHREMEQAEECPQYIHSNGVRTGCTFTRDTLPEFSAFNICVNSSSPKVALRSAFFSLQVQNHVKPAAIEAVHLEAGLDRRLQVHWDLPHESIPSHCLEYEVETSEGVGGQQLLQRNVTREMTLTFLSMDGAHCFRVRSRVHHYCADRGFWSDWSRWFCHPEQPPGFVSDAVVVCALVIVVIISMVVLSLCGLALWTKCKGREWKTMHFCPLHKLMEYSKGLTACDPFPNKTRRNK
ncbi:interleukin-13 receptor subunit alpha-2-like isoform X2 [Salvelinus namaycush]|uniref:Interleukin-13 receptor subunit alpha-2-like isoform X2 n=1 Tax=Salvelinus namaycush TaxID=8040 RepID=A0A8U0TM82_SALNM|nr:interleukin-13 receptor subunit alpha-2-like isoform X2 [Salvelinus namaycush]